MDGLLGLESCAYALKGGWTYIWPCSNERQQSSAHASLIGYVSRSKYTHALNAPMIEGLSGMLE